MVGRKRREFGTVGELGVSPAGAEILDALGLTHSPDSTEPAATSVADEDDWSHISVLHRA
ncbi:MAG: hypothetical protein ACJA07_003381 [Rhodococcus sp. (in: high G+C Gram-positive bacteria)]|jgi:hypothetical protein